MDWSCSDLGDAIGLFKQKMTLILEDENILTAVAQAMKYVEESVTMVYDD